MGEQNFLNIEQIIPTKDSEEFMIGIADKVREEIEGATEEKNRHKVRREFWVEIIRAMATKSNLFQNISPGPYGWLSAGSGVRGLGFNFAASRKYGRAELYTERGDKEENKFIFDLLAEKKASIDAAFGDGLVWERLDDGQASRIKSETVGNIFDREQWPVLVEFMTNTMVKMENAFREPLVDINRRLRSRGDSPRRLPPRLLAARPRGHAARRCFRISDRISAAALGMLVPGP
jgi:hypothetical protein